MSHTSCKPSVNTERRDHSNSPWIRFHTMTTLPVRENHHGNTHSTRYGYLPGCSNCYPYTQQTSSSRRIRSLSDPAQPCPGDIIGKTVTSSDNYAPKLITLYRNLLGCWTMSLTRRISSQSSDLGIANGRANSSIITGPPTPFVPLTELTPMSIPRDDDRLEMRSLRSRSEEYYWNFPLKRQN